MHCSEQPPLLCCVLYDQRKSTIEDQQNHCLSDSFCFPLQWFNHRSAVVRTRAAQHNHRHLALPVAREILFPIRNLTSRRYLTDIIRNTRPFTIRAAIRPSLCGCGHVHRPEQPPLLCRLPLEHRRRLRRPLCGQHHSPGPAALARVRPVSTSCR